MRKRTQLKPKLASATILETLIAMVIIAFSLSVTFYFFASLTASGRLPLKIQAHHRLQQEVIRLEHETGFRDSEEEAEGLIIQRKFSAYPSNGSAGAGKLVLATVVIQDIHHITLTSCNRILPLNP